MKKSIAAVVLLTFAAGAATHLYAADDNKSPEGRDGNHRMHHFDPSAKAAGHLKRMKEELKITPAQEPAWQNFATQIQQQADAMKVKLAENKPAQGQTAPQLMTQRIEMSKLHLASMQKSAEAFSQLYTVLTPEQKAIADKQAARFGHDHHPGH